MKNYHQNKNGYNFNYINLNLNSHSRTKDNSLLIINNKRNGCTSQNILLNSENQLRPKKIII